ncbi:hypothetical protein BC828DRAFT_393947 [Blastocladiella britannica]|nr:hypothetical protein BC828DRAFT_393947 [Blastocladiella britannica]
MGRGRGQPRKIAHKNKSFSSASSSNAASAENLAATGSTTPQSTFLPPGGTSMAPITAGVLIATDPLPAPSSSSNIGGDKKQAAAAASKKGGKRATSRSQSHESLGTSDAHAMIRRRRPSPAAARGDTGSNDAVSVSPSLSGVMDPATTAIVAGIESATAHDAWHSTNVETAAANDGGAWVAIDIPSLEPLSAPIGSSGTTLLPGTWYASQPHLLGGDAAFARDPIDEPSDMYTAGAWVNESGDGLCVPFQYTPFTGLTLTTAKGNDDNNEPFGHGVSPASPSFGLGMPAAHTISDVATPVPRRAPFVGSPVSPTLFAHTGSTSPPLSFPQQLAFAPHSASDPVANGPVQEVDNPVVVTPLFAAASATLENSQELDTPPSLPTPADLVLDATDHQLTSNEAEQTPETCSPVSANGPVSTPIVYHPAHLMRYVQLGSSFVLVDDNTGDQSNALPENTFWIPVEGSLAEAAAAAITTTLSSSSNSSSSACNVVRDQQHDHSEAVVLVENHFECAPSTALILHPTAKNDAVFKGCTLALSGTAHRWSMGVPIPIKPAQLVVPRGRAPRISSRAGMGQ